MEDFHQANIVSSLILGANIFYPNWTYEDLVLPTLALKDLNLDQLANKSSMSANDDHTINPFSSISFHSIIPAFRSLLSCQLYNQSEISHNIIYESKSKPNNLTIGSLDFNITRKECGIGTNGRWNNATVSLDVSEASPWGYFGTCTTANRDFTLTDIGCNSTLHTPYFLLI